ncbi:MAG: hypothetical protein ACKPCM_11600 [Pseudanabaena sp.]
MLSITFFSLSFNSVVFTLSGLIILCVLGIPFTLMLYRQLNCIVPKEVLSFPFTTCETSEFQQIFTKIKDFKESISKGFQVSELALSEYEINALANGGRGLLIMAPKIMHYCHYTLDKNSINRKDLTYPDASSIRGCMVMIDSIQISIENGKLNGSITRISQNDWKPIFGRSRQFNGWMIFRDIFYINELSEIDDIVSQLESIQIEEKYIRFVPKRLANKSMEA